MSRIYDNKPMSALPVESVAWKTAWTTSQYQTGAGVLVEGCVKDRTRHVIIDSAGEKTRYVALYVAVRRSHRRKFDASGVEIEPNFSETEKVRTGFLNTSYKTAAKGHDDALSLDQLMKIVQPSNLLRVTQKHAQHDCIVLWIEDNAMCHVELAVNDSVRIRTKGDGPFVQSITRLDAASAAMTVCNYSGGEQVGTSWTDKIMAVKSASGMEDSKAQCEAGEGAADDEWDD